LWHGILPVACGIPQASVVLDRHKQKRSALLSWKKRVAYAIVRIDGVPSIGAEYGTHGLEAHATEADEFRAGFVCQVAS
jgi:hypothetical protein